MYETFIMRRRIENSKRIGRDVEERGGRRSVSPPF